jgi:hypothetical protein
VVVSVVPYSHYFTVRDKKEVIKNKIVADIDNTKKMFDDYESHTNKRILFYEQLLNTAINGKDFDHSGYLAMGFQNNGETDNDQKQRIMRVFKDDLMPAQYDTTKAYAIKWLDDAKLTAVNWKPIGLMSVINSIDKEAINWLSQLKKYDNSTKKDNSSISFAKDISFASLERELTERNTPSLLAILSAIILQLLIFLPYFFTYRDPRHSGLFHELFKRDDVDNEVGGTL